MILDLLWETFPRLSRSDVRLVRNWLLTIEKVSDESVRNLWLGVAPQFKTARGYAARTS